MRHVTCIVFIYVGKVIFDINNVKMFIGPFASKWGKLSRQPLSAQESARCNSSQFECRMTHPNNDEIRASHRLSLDENDWTVLHALQLCTHAHVIKADGQRQANVHRI